MKPLPFIVRACLALAASHALGVSHVLAASNALAQTCSAVSGAQTNALIELYTSEGCSSCPPADQWLSRLKQQHKGLGQWVPLALHVDYWDYIGWQDRFAQPAFAKRQRDIAALGGARAVYTPQVVMQGKDHRSWVNDARFHNEIAAINRMPAKAEIKLTLEMQASETMHVMADIHSQETRPLVYYIALQEHQLASTVKAGENRGTVLRHDYVVRQWLGPFKLNADGHTQASHSLNIDRSWKPRDLTVVAFVEQPNSGDILQALALPSCENK